ncbi:MAG: hypothetical protein QF831_05760, partial [Candidatus Thalassarchaeaceae archaeon]|nr:hypothetical protein [Candidatus Thalassarchaeaceae archaeon]
MVDAFPATGIVQNLGRAVGDFDGDGDEDLYMANLEKVPDRLYLNDGQGWFLDHTGDQLPIVVTTSTGVV